MIIIIIIIIIIIQYMCDVIIYSCYFNNDDLLLNIYIYIYIYIYIVTHWQTVSLYHNSSVWRDTADDWSWDRNPPNFTLDLVSYRSANKRTTSAREL